jgi:hypothetical protein
MAKDARGHGSNSRGGSYPNIDTNLKGPGRHVGYSNGPWQINKLGAGYLATHSRTGESFRGDSLGHVSDQLAARDAASKTSYSPDSSGAHNSPLVSNAAAARELASGSPKSAPAPVHGGMSTAQREAFIKTARAVTPMLDKNYGKVLR